MYVVKVYEFQDVEMSVRGVWGFGPDGFRGEVFF